MDSRYRPWIAGLAGLLLGWACQAVVRKEPAADLGGGDGAPANGSRSRAEAKGTTPLASGPTTILLNEISAATAAQCEERVRAYHASLEAGREIELEAIFRRWLSFESADEILAKVSGLQGQWGSRWNHAFFQAWVALDESAAMNREKHGVLGAARAFHAIENGDPSFADHFADAARVSWSFGEQVAVAMRALGRDQPEVAKLIATAEIPEMLKLKGIVAVVRGMALDDPAAALVWLQTLGLEGDRASESFNALFSAWEMNDPVAAREAIVTAGFDGGVRLMDPGDARGQMELALRQDAFAGVDALYQRLSGSDIDWDKARSPMPAIDHDGWYSADPESAMREAEQLPPGKARDYILEVICGNLAAHDLDQAVSLAERNGIKSWYLESKLDEPSEEMRQAAFAAPEETFGVLFDPGEPGQAAADEQSRIYKLAMEWSEANPELASEWLITLPPPSPEGSRLDDLLFRNTIGYNWARNDALGASRWMEELPDGPIKSCVWSAMHDRVSEYSPDLAFALTLEYADATVREGLLAAQLKRAGQSIGYPAAFELLKSPALSAQERAALTETLRAAMSEPSR